MGFLEFAHADAFQHERPPARGRQGAHDLETVARSFQHDQICGGGVFLGPTGELGMGSRLNIFSVTASAGVRPWSSAAVKVSGWESKPITRGFGVAFGSFYSLFGGAGGRKQVRRITGTQVCGAVPM